MLPLVPTELLPEAQSLAADVLFEAGRSIPGSVQYVAKRFARPATWMGDEKAQLRYHYEPSRAAENLLEMRFGLTTRAKAVKQRLKALTLYRFPFRRPCWKVF